MDFTELLIKRRSIRDFEDKEVPLDLVKGIINESILAPNACNAPIQVRVHFLIGSKNIPTHPRKISYTS